MGQAIPAMTDAVFTCNFERMKELMSARLKRLREAANLSQTDVAARLGIKPQSVQQWESGRTQPRGKRLAQLSLLYGESQGYILDGEDGVIAESSATARDSVTAYSLGHIDAWDSNTPLGEDEVELPLFREVELSGGHGSTMVQENHGAKLRFAKSTLRKKGIEESVAACCFVTGDSMLPILPHGSTVGVDKSSLNIVDGNIYAIDHGGLLRVKYLYRIPGGGVRIRSANRDHYPDEDLTPDQLEHFRVIGRVFWYSVLL